jgi:hypothetical protein
LKPDTTYAIRLNSINKSGFSSAMENEPLPLTVIAFRTAAATTPAPPPTPLNFSLEVKAQKTGPDWMMFNATTQGQEPGSMPAVETHVNGNAQIAGLWVPAWGLTNLQPGQVIDRDPFTDFVTSVSSLNNEFATITLTGPRQQFDYPYRRTNGMLMRLKTTEFYPNIPGRSNTLELDLVGSQ